MMCIILTKAQAAAIRGMTKQSYALDPKPLRDGTFALPERVLDDPVHEFRHRGLREKQTRDVTDSEWLREEEEP